jgi:hypothetical protein
MARELEDVDMFVSSNRYDRYFGDNEKKKNSLQKSIIIKRATISNRRKVKGFELKSVVI